MAKKNTSKKITQTATKKKPKAKHQKSNVPDFLLENGFWKKNRLPALILFGISFFLYIQSYNYDFVLDDKIVYHQNYQVKKGISGISEIFSTESMVGYFGEQQNLLQGNRYRPLSIATFALEHEFFGDNSYKFEKPLEDIFRANPDLAAYIDPILKTDNIFEVKYPTEESYLNALGTIIPQETIGQYKNELLQNAAYSNSGISHVINTLLYAFLALLLFRVLAMLFPTMNENWYIGLAFVAALLFAVHPTHVEAVANVKGRDEILGLLGALGALYFSLKYIATDKPIHLVASGIIFLLGLLAKENVMTFIAIIPLTTYFFTKSSTRKYVLTITPLAIAFLIFLWMRMSAVEAAHLFDFGAGKEVDDLMNNPFLGMSGAQKSATIFYTLGYYLKLLIFPHPLTHDYYPYHIPVMNWGNISSILSFLAYVGMGIYAIIGLKKKSIISYGILFYLITLSIVSNLFITTGTFMNERFLFFPSIGFCLIIAYFISRKLPAPVINIGVLALLVIGFAAKTFTRVPVWENGYALNSSGVAVSPNSARANLFMGTSIFKEFYKKEKDTAKRQEYLALTQAYVDKALNIHPTYGSALTMKVTAATEQYRIKSEIAPLLKAFTNIVKARGKKQGRGQDEGVEIYLNFFRDQQRWIPELTVWSYQIGYDYFLKIMGDYPVAKKYIDYGLSLDPADQKLNEANQELRKLLGQ